MGNWYQRGGGGSHFVDFSVEKKMTQLNNENKKIIYIILLQSF